MPLAPARRARIGTELAALPLAELFELAGEDGADGGAALGEHVEQLVGDTGDLGLTRDDRSPVDTETVGRARRAAPTGTGRRASAGAASGSGRPTPASARRPSAPSPRSRRGCGSGDRRLGKWSGGTWRSSGPFVSGWSRPPFERMRVVDPNRSRCASAADDRDVVRFEQTLVAGQRPPHRQRLRRRERRIEPRHRPHHAARRSCTGRATPDPAAYPIVGSRPDSSSSSASTFTVPDNPSPAA